MKAVIVTLLICCMLSGCNKQRQQYGTVCGIPIYSPSSNNLTISIQEELLNGNHPIGAYEDNGKVKFIYE